MAGPADGGPLQGLKVLDLTENMAGPFCTMILADMGAEVVKLERPGKGDAVRAWGDGSERNPYFRYINRNKKGITLDYKQPRRAGALSAACQRHGRSGRELSAYGDAARRAGIRGAARSQAGPDLCSTLRSRL